MRLPRSAGILLHPTSLPGPHGIGDLGPSAHRFLDVLSEAGCRIWQVLPLGPTGYGNSPYQSFSAFAGNPLLIHVPGPALEGDAQVVDYPSAIAHKRALLDAAIADFVPDAAFDAFVAANDHWLAPFALFMALKEGNGNAAWADWPGDHVPGPETRFPADVRARCHARRVEQFLFWSQLRDLRAAAAERGIALMGDMPIYVSHDSADVWAHRTLFQLNTDGSCRVQAGVPPDYFSATGQLWGNPLPDWEVMRADGYAWWISRLRAAFSHFDLVRLDHFRGFEAYWEVPGNAATAVDGRWVPGPGRAFFDAISDALGARPIIAENLGEITEDVEALRAACGFPGMGVLQFAFGGDATDNPHLPHQWSHETVAYTGTHDNDTTLGWWESLATDEAQRARVLAYLAADEAAISTAFIRAVLASVADTAIIPLQDVLGLGTAARMNTPGREDGNWAWRFSWDQVTPGRLAALRRLVETYGRLPAPAPSPA